MEANRVGVSRVELPTTTAPTEPPENIPMPSNSPRRRVGFVLVGWAHLTLKRGMPAFGQSKHCKSVVLEGGDRYKAQQRACGVRHVGSAHRQACVMNGL